MTPQLKKCLIDNHGVKHDHRALSEIEELEKEGYIFTINSREKVDFKSPRLRAPRDLGFWPTRRSIHIQEKVRVSQEFERFIKPKISIFFEKLWTELMANPDFEFGKYDLETLITCHSPIPEEIIRKVDTDERNLDKEL